MAYAEYEKMREKYKPTSIKWLLITESGPPSTPKTSTRYFYKVDYDNAENDRLFSNTIQALYKAAVGRSRLEIHEHKAEWLAKLQSDGIYLIEALEESMPHEAKTAQRRQALKDITPRLIERLNDLVSPETRIILIKSNPFNILTEPLKAAGFNVLNTETVDYPGYWREEPYRKKLAALVKANS